VLETVTRDELIVTGIWCCLCQKYRHVDYIQFENPMLMERFLDYWRKTGNQRIGFLYGRYEHHKDVPLGIKAVVAAIYEPEQVNIVSV